MKYDIWSDGYATNGNSAGPAQMARGVEALTFKDACIKHFKGDSYFDVNRMTYWGGCRLAPSLKDMYCNDY
jgi:hypothetical protein